ncbi:uncharacterized protein LOC131658814 [Vicia villosa]|uniref:uncharacterized protein LOC131658814 n=1 Tax=Vicia villosa TaxID=3911 RepID=UPI00273BFEE1|nr:uncharacterized protein LOC131658814 [Vicia villosa]
MEDEANKEKQARNLMINRMMNIIFNKNEYDFPSLKEYNDYKEDATNMTFKLIEGEDVEFIEAKIERYVNENMELIETRNNQRTMEMQGPFWDEKIIMEFVESTSPGASSTNLKLTPFLTTLQNISPFKLFRKYNN